MAVLKVPKVVPQKLLPSSSFSFFRCQLVSRKLTCFGVLHGGPVDLDSYDRFRFPWHTY